LNLLIFYVNFGDSPTTANHSSDRYVYSRFGCFIAIWVLEDPLNLDGWKLSADGKCLNIGADGFYALISSRVDELIPG